MRFQQVTSIYFCSNHLEQKKAFQKAIQLAFDHVEQDKPDFLNHIS